MGKTYRLWESRLKPFGSRRRHQQAKREHYDEKKDRFAFDPRKDYTR